MSIFSKKEASSKIAKKISDLQAQLSTMEAQVSSKETEVEKAIDSGGNTDKLFEQISQLQGNVAARRLILTKMETELGAALAQEDQAVRLAELDQFGKLVEKNISGLERSLADILDAAEVFLDKEGAFRRQYSQFFAIPGPAGINFAILPRYDVGFIAQALTIKPVWVNNSVRQ